MSTNPWISIKEWDSQSSVEVGRPFFAALVFRNCNVRVLHLIPLWCPCLNYISVPQPRDLLSYPLQNMHLSWSLMGLGREGTCLLMVGEGFWRTNCSLN